MFGFWTYGRFSENILHVFQKYRALAIVGLFVMSNCESVDGYIRSQEWGPRIIRSYGRALLDHMGGGVGILRDGLGDGLVRSVIRGAIVFLGAFLMFASEVYGFTPCCAFCYIKLC